MKNFDFITKLAEVIPSFSQLHAYCDKAEIFQKTFPEESASNARKALEWLVRNYLHMANVTLEPRETLNEMLKHPDFGWVVAKDSKIMYHICVVGIGYVVIDSMSPIFSEAFADYEFTDGTPFGIKEEE